MITFDGQQPQKDTLPHIAWHTAFIEAIKEDLSEYKDKLEFFPEFQLTFEPLKIDCVVIKKAAGVEIKKGIAAAFKENNILEYKSPDDYVSIADFHKVYGYASLYASLEEAPITGMTISFVESHYPMKLLEYLKKAYGYRIAENKPGIYTVSGDILPIQIIDSRRVSENDSLWLKHLSNKLDSFRVNKITVEAHKQGKVPRLMAYLNVIAQANSEALREAVSMSSTLTLEQVFKDVGWLDKWKAEGRVEGKAEGRVEGEEHKALAIAKNMIDMGFTFEAIVSVTQLEPEKVKALY